MRWPVERWGARAVVLAGFGTADHLRTAVQLLSGDVPTSSTSNRARRDCPRGTSSPVEWISPRGGLAGLNVCRRAGSNAGWTEEKRLSPASASGFGQPSVPSPPTPLPRRGAGRPRRSPSPATCSQDVFSTEAQRTQRKDKNRYGRQEDRKRRLRFPGFLHFLLIFLLCVSVVQFSGARSVMSTARSRRRAATSPDQPTTAKSGRVCASIAGRSAGHRADRRGVSGRVCASIAGRSAGHRADRRGVSGRVCASIAGRSAGHRADRRGVSGRVCVCITCRAQRRSSGRPPGCVWASVCITCRAQRRSYGIVPRTKVDRTAVYLLGPAPAGTRELRPVSERATLRREAVPAAHLLRPAIGRGPWHTADWSGR